MVGRKPVVRTPGPEVDEPATIEPGTINTGTATTGRATLRIDPEQIREKAARLDEVAFLVQQEYVRLVEGLNRLGEFWGDDQAGSAFASTYVEGRDNTLTGIDNVRGILELMAVGLRSSGDGFEASENNAVDEAQRLQRSLEV